MATLLLIAGILAAQSTTARIDGTIQDSTGAIIPGATVTATEKRTQSSATATSNAAGNFVFTTLQPGIYTLTVDAGGFRKAVLNDIELTLPARFPRS